MSSAWSHDEIPQILMEFMEACAGADPEIFQGGGGWLRKILKEKC